jgi:hypothetical protein
MPWEAPIVIPLFLLWIGLADPPLFGIEIFSCFLLLLVI